METKWSDIGFLGSLLFILYAVSSILIFFTPPSFYGPIAPLIAILLAILGIIAGICFSLGFHGLRIELYAPSPWITYFTIIWSIGAWLFIGASQIVMALGFTIGLVYWFFSLAGILLMYLFCGMFFFMIRKQLGARNRFAFSASMLFLINGLAWLSFIGFGILALAASLCLFIFTPEAEYSIFSPVIRFFSPKRVSTIRNWGPILLIVYSLLGMKWLINGIFPLPVAAAAFMNVFSLIIGGLTIVGITIILRAYEKKYENNMLWFAQLAWIPGFLLLLMADLQWLMSNASVFIDISWGVQLYGTLIFYMWWSSIPLAIFSFLAALGFLQIYRLPEVRGETSILLVHLGLLFSGFLWLIIAISVSDILPIVQWLLFYLGLYLLDIFSLGFIGFLFTSFFLWRQWTQELRKK
jgi:hypothetical protein